MMSNEPKAPAIVQALVILGLSAAGWAWLWLCLNLLRWLALRDPKLCLG